MSDTQYGVYAIQVISTTRDDLSSYATTPKVATAQRIANLHSSYGQYFVAYGDGSGIAVKRADLGLPLAGVVFDYSGHATSAAGDQNPALLESARRFVRLYFESAGATYRTESGDGCVTWRAPVSQIPGILPSAAAGTVREEVLVATASDNTLLATVQYPGDRWPNDNHTGSTEGTSSDPPYTVLDSAGSPIVTDGTGVAISGAPNGRIIMALIVSGESALSHWWSGDALHTATRIT